MIGVSQGAVLDAAVEWLVHGWLNLSWWQLVLVTLAMTHITIVSVTVFLHRHQAHRALDLHPMASHFSASGSGSRPGRSPGNGRRFTASTTPAASRPKTRTARMCIGIRKVLLEGAELYRAESKNQETLARFGHGTPDDWIERNLYTRFSAGRAWA
jgi:stearoyl-CoA desaturase (delta-9 desaturase)